MRFSFMYSSRVLPGNLLVNTKLDNNISYKTDINISSESKAFVWKCMDITKSELV